MSRKVFASAKRLDEVSSIMGEVGSNLIVPLGRSGVFDGLRAIVIGVYNAVPAGSSLFRPNLVGA